MPLVIVIVPVSVIWSAAVSAAKVTVATPLIRPAPLLSVTLPAPVPLTGSRTQSISVLPLPVGIPMQVPLSVNLNVLLFFVCEVEAVMLIG